MEVETSKGLNELQLLLFREGHFSAGIYHVCSLKLIQVFLVPVWIDLTPG